MAVLSELNIQNPHLLSGSKGDIKCYRLYMICGTRFRNNDWYMMVLHDEMICDGQWLVTIFIACIIQRILYHFYQFIGIWDFYLLNTGTVQKAQTGPGPKYLENGGFSVNTTISSICIHKYVQHFFIKTKNRTLTKGI